MPQKLNRAGEMQNYVPAGNGDASGEYGDSEGNNIHFKVFKKPKNIKSKYKVSYQEKYNKQYSLWENKLLKILNDEEEAEEGISTKDIDFGDKFEESVKKAVENIKHISEVDGINSLYDIERFKKQLSSFLGNKWWDSNYALKSGILENTLKDFLEDDKKELDKKLDKKAREEVLSKFKKLKEKESIEQSLSKVNKENYDKTRKAYQEAIDGGDKEKIKSALVEYKKYHNNCQRCVQAYVFRQLGYDVQAKGREVSLGDVSGWNDKLGKLRWEMASFNGGEVIGAKSSDFLGGSIGETSDNELGKMGKSQRKNITKIVEDAGEGSMHIVAVAWKGSGAHVFIAQNVGGKCRFIDPQSGNEDVSGYFDTIIPKHTSIVRVDNLSLNPNMKEVMENVGESDK